MKFGVVIANQRATADRVGDELERVEALGYDSAWMPGIPNGPDVLTLFSATAQRTSRIEVGPAIVSAHGRHPVALASQALTTHDALRGRLTLGIGVSHQRVVEDFFGLDYSHPARFMAEYLQVLHPLLNGEKADFAGQLLRTSFRLDIASPEPAPSVFTAAVGPKMLDVAGTLSDGAATWMVGLRTLSEVTVPLTHAAAQRALRPAPRILASLPFALTSDDETATAWAREEFGMYGRLPAYKAVLEREGFDSAAGIAIHGDEGALTKAVDRVRDAGVTDLQITPFGDDETRRRTVDFLATLR
ncbi:MAG TPA: TIGR03564 family F420-dependent LLM class oxidoreductase [Acidimicrobiales bacterium]|nr:TIGR03564 family F420-dependent LLM class oxidoreductase [Acidimicrobiales bacterium]